MSQNTIEKKNSVNLVILVGVIILLVILVIFMIKSNGRTTQYEPREINTVLLDKDNHQMYVELIKDSPKIIMIHDFLSNEECDELIELSEKDGFNRSTVQGETNKISEDRTSHTKNFKKNETDLIERIEKRAAVFSRLPLENTEPIQIVKYNPKQEYKHHYDFFVPDAEGTENALKRGGQRHVTFFVYLNDMHKDETGAHTDFPKLNLKIKPKKGMAVFWTNINPNGTEDFRTLHAGMPPTHSTKYGLNIWIRQSKFS